jgi:hypothetical protein
MTKKTLAAQRKSVRKPTKKKAVKARPVQTARGTAKTKPVATQPAANDADAAIEAIANWPGGVPFAFSPVPPSEEK